jgi:hypothetical protein
MKSDQMKSDIVKLDRGTVKRITFELLYPNGQLKQVTFENDCENDFGTFSAIFFDDHSIEALLKPAVSKVSDRETAETIEDTWRNIDKGPNPQWPPAMLILNTDGAVIPRCGGHKKGKGPETKPIK